MGGCGDPPYVYTMAMRYYDSVGTVTVPSEDCDLRSVKIKPLPAKSRSQRDLKAKVLNLANGKINQ
jgi:hypothetical protein